MIWNVLLPAAALQVVLIALKLLGGLPWLPWLAVLAPAVLVNALVLAGLACGFAATWRPARGSHERQQCAHLPAIPAQRTQRRD
jgi:hypothetical protein